MTRHNCYIPTNNSIFLFGIYLYKYIYFNSWFLYYYWIYFTKIFNFLGKKKGNKIKIPKFYSLVHNKRTRQYACPTLTETMVPQVSFRLQFMQYKIVCVRNGIMLLSDNKVQHNKVSLLNTKMIRFKQVLCGKSVLMWWTLCPFLTIYYEKIKSAGFLNIIIQIFNVYVLLLKTKYIFIIIIFKFANFETE